MSVPSHSDPGELPIRSAEERNGGFRSWPLLVLAFGCVILLMTGSDLATMERTRQLQTSLSEVNDEYQHRARTLDELRSGIHLSGLVLRDYLLDPRTERSARYREQMVAVRKQVDQDLQDLLRSMPSSETAKLSDMRQELESYFESLDPVFAWTPQEKQAYSFAFLRHRVIPKRESVLRIAADVEAFNETALEERRSRVEANESEFSAFLYRVMILSIAAGLLVACVSIFRVSQLERRTDQQHKRTLRAEARMRQLSQQLVHAQEEERKSLSRELHDEVGQMLTGLRMEYRGLSRLNGVPAADFEARLEQGRTLLDQCVQAVRDIAMGLRPSMLDDLGLEAALQWQARDFCRRHDIPVNISVQADLSALPERYKTNLYRIVQESLTNCAKHSRAKTISVSITEDEDTLKLTIEDDGVGIQAGSYGKGLGLISMQERARELGGSMDIHSAPSRGATLTVVMPMERSGAIV